jgi:hypothetical protein
MLRQALCGIAMLLVPTLIQAGPGPASDSAKSETPAERVKKALDQIVDVDIENQSLQNAVVQLREQTKVPFVLDRTTVILQGMNPDENVINLKLAKTKLRSALRSFLGPHNLTYAIIGDSVIITTDEMAVYRQLKQRVSVDADRVQLGVALKQLARETGTNLLVDAKVLKESQSPVTLQVDDVPLETAVRLLCEGAGLKPVRMGNVLYVTAKATATELRAEADLAPTPPRGGLDPDVLNAIGGAAGAGVMVAPALRGAPALPVVPPPPPPPAPKDEPADKPKDKK